MKLIVGLGNPGREYENTRHNCGYMFINSLVEKMGLKLKENKKLKCFLAEALVNGEKIILVEPTTYMNLSGECVKAVVDYYGINIEDILVISDDMDLEVGRRKIKPAGGTGGHKGLKSIIEHLGTEDIKRMRIGIGKPLNKEVIDFVLERFGKTELNKLNETLDICYDILVDFINLKFDNFMNKYN